MTGIGIGFKIRERRNVSGRIAATVLIVTLLANGATAQISHDRRECCRIWGDPISDEIKTNGIESLMFQSNGVSVEIGLLDGNAQKAVYRLASMDEPVLKHFLRLNSEDLQWQVWAIPSPSPMKTNDQQWMRSDEMAMAQLSSNVLTVLGPKWSQYLEASQPQGSMDKPVVEKAPPPIKPSPPLSPRVDILGFWRNEYPGNAPVVLHIEDSGDLSWIVFGTKVQSEWKARWNRESSDEPLTYTLTEIQPRSSAPPRIIGRVQRDSETTLRFRAEKPLPLASARYMRPEMIFERVATLPRWKASPPAILPAKGDSKRTALRLLGNPDGTMQLGRREVLVYPWGNIWIENGIVTGFE